ncbi:MAG: hypothetical protein NC483_06095 [Ruminococcus sp.]|nr:hypothetical protein [Ruminococcus sp.]
MKHINYNNTKTELELVNINIEAINEKEELLKSLKKDFLKSKEGLQEQLLKMESKLKELKGIEESLMYEILVKGVNVTKAVDTVAFKYDMDPSNIWKNYYPKVKEKLKEIESSESPV